MKVLSYLQVNCLPDNEYYEYEVFIKKQYNMTVEEFYSQPFKPEMITELFKGWLECPDLYVSDLQEIPEGHHVPFKWYIDFDSGIYIFKIFEYRDGDLVEDYLKIHKIPSTLDRFICHCQDAGIELTWKEQNNEQD